jgi:glycosyltransferase involved in cell wall biosynthesis
VDVSILVSTYERPETLQRTLWAFAAQSRRDFEILVADDGSSETTARLIAEARTLDGLDIRHVWHAHDGFRKSVIFNKAIGEARGDYLICVDGDCIPRRDFVAVHMAYARPGRFLSGGVIRLKLAAEAACDRECIVSGRAFALPWLLRHVIPAALPKTLASGPLGDLVPWRWITPQSFNGHNSSAWRRDIERVNGFDERMAYGGLDRELGERLENAGVRGTSVRYTAICLHIEHGRAYVDAAGLAANNEIRRQTRDERRVWTDYGITKRPPAA